MADIKDFEGLAKTYVHSQGLLGKARTVIPTAESSDEEWNQLYDALGRPEAPDKYGFIEGVDEQFKEVHGDLLSGMTKAMYEAGLTQRQADKLAQAYVGSLAEQQKNWGVNADASLQKATTELKSAWGDAYEAKLEAANEAATELFGDELQSFRQIRLADGSFLGDSALMVRLLSALGEANSEGRLPGGGRRATLTPDEAAAELRALEADTELRQAWMNRDHPRHQEVLERRMQLRKMMKTEEPGGEEDIFAPRL
jgi:hypothetical protein